MIRIIDAKPLLAYNVELTLSDGQVIRRDLEPLLKGSVSPKSEVTTADFANSV